jgi:hypothetical protein
LAEDQQKYFPDSRLGKPFRLHYSKRADVTVERLQEIFGTPKYVKRYLPSLFLDIEWI